MFPAKFAAPIVASGRPVTFAGQRVRDEPWVVFASPVGYLDLADVASAVGGDAVWVWLDEFDDDPTSLLTSIAHGVCRRVEDSRALPSIAGSVIEATAEGWPHGVASFGEQLGEVLAGRTVVVASPGRRVDGRAMAMLCDGLVPAMGAAARLVVVTGHSAGVDRLSGVPVIGADALRVRPDEIGAVVAGADPGLPAGLVRRAVRLAEGRGATLSSVLLAGSLLGPDAFARAVKGAGDLDELLSTLIGLSLRGARPDVLGSLQVVRRVGFVHPRLLEAAVGQASMIGAPWLLALEDDWALADPLWRHALPVTLGPASGLSTAALGRLAGQLLDEGAPELAIRLCREVGDVAGLARGLDQIARRPDAAHRWEVLEGDLYGAVELPVSGHPRWPRQARDARGWRRLSRYLRPRNTLEPGRPEPSDPEPAVRLVSPSHPEVLPGSPDPGCDVQSPPPERAADDDIAPVAPVDGGRRSGCEARLLGPFELSLDGTTVGEWAGTRGRSVLKYLLVHRDRPVRKETLMETFWPGGDPDASRNCLNVAVSSLRRSLRPLFGDVPVVLHRHGTYQFNPAIEVWVDVEHFESNSAEGLRRYTNDDLPGATVVLTDAVDLYRGAFLDDDPFEEWTSATRERLRVRFLDVLDRLSEIAFVQGRYDTCIEVGHRILREDCCREDTHRRIMRCHSRQGRPHLGLRQYHTCVESLRVELAVEPSTDTVELYEEIRQHRVV